MPCKRDRVESRFTVPEDVELDRRDNFWGGEKMTRLILRPSRHISTGTYYCCYCATKYDIYLVKY